MYTVSVVPIATMALFEAVLISLFVDYLYIIMMLRKELCLIVEDLITTPCDPLQKHVL